MEALQPITGTTQKPNTPVVTSGNNPHVPPTTPHPTVTSVDNSHVSPTSSTNDTILASNDIKRRRRLQRQRHRWHRLLLRRHQRRQQRSADMDLLDRLS